MLAHRNPHSPNAHQLAPVHFQRCDRRSARRCKSNEFGEARAPRKMVLPRVSMRMKQGDLFLGVGIFDDRAIRFMAVASGTRKAEVFKRRFSAGRTRCDMLDFKGRNRQSFRRLAIGAAIGEMLGYSTPELGGNIGAHRPVAPAC